MLVLRRKVEFYKGVQFSPQLLHLFLGLLHHPHEEALLARTGDLEMTGGSSLFWNGAGKKSSEVLMRQLAFQGPLIRINLEFLNAPSHLVSNYWKA